MAKHIDHKLRLTAALLGTATRKDFAAAFRKVNPATSFDVDRANKWLQGRAQPRERSVYEDWAKLLDVDRPATWIADCDLASFFAAVCARHGIAREELERRAGEQVRSANARRERGSTLPLGEAYLCYSHARSPYFQGQLVRGILSIDASSRPERLAATYVEELPTGSLQASGSIVLSNRGMFLDLQESSGATQLLFCLFPPSRPGSVLGGYMSGMTIFGTLPQPSVTRIVMIRLPALKARPRKNTPYLASNASLVLELATFGLKLDNPGRVDQCLNRFLFGFGSAGIDQVPIADFRVLLETFDRYWIENQT